MRPRSAGASRPVGTDGTDHPYRMTVDMRYKKVVEKKLQLQKLLVAQAVFHLIKAVQVVLMALNMEPIATTTIAACCFGGAAVLSGTVGLKWTSSRLLQLFLFATGAALMLSFLPLLLGYPKVLRSFRSNTGYKLLVFDGLEVAQDIVGVILQLFEISTSLSLLQQLSRKRA
ncbi:hypothetical protein GOP47_0014274 [Adiantum capillus-veneris]|uniref:Uncharacterized protein n=1 Tax=Adiantum capillus-veneris TaxID=13818 RepID=A0A9D4UM06_ADICA|nr:hypothetical protein GOP47_0014274 [Adiantum capillus-veneris]